MPRPKGSKNKEPKIADVGHNSGLTGNEREQFCRDSLNDLDTIDGEMDTLRKRKKLVSKALRDQGFKGQDISQARKEIKMKDGASHREGVIEILGIMEAQMCLFDDNSLKAFERARAERESNAPDPEEEAMSDAA